MEGSTKYSPLGCTIEEALSPFAATNTGKWYRDIVEVADRLVIMARWQRGSVKLSGEGAMHPLWVASSVMGGKFSTETAEDGSRKHDGRQGSQAPGRLLYIPVGQDLSIGLAAQTADAASAA